MRRVLILGGGFGGIATAVALRERLDAADEVVLVERRPTFVMGLRKNWALLAEGALAEGERPLASLEGRGIQRRARDPIEAIEPDGAIRDRRRRTDRARTRWSWPSARNATPTGFPGFREHAINIYDRDEFRPWSRGDRGTSPADGWSSGSSERPIRARRPRSSSRCCCGSASRSAGCRPR